MEWKIKVYLKHFYINYRDKSPKNSTHFSTPRDFLCVQTNKRFFNSRGRITEIAIVRRPPNLITYFLLINVLIADYYYW